MRFVEDAGINRLYSHISNPNEVVIFISVDRGESSPSENSRKRRDFKKVMSMYRFGYFKIKGGYVENPGTPDETEVEDEASFAVFAPVEKEDAMLFLMLELGRITNQDSIMFVKGGKAYWISCPKQKLDSLLSDDDNIFQQMEDRGDVTPLGKFSLKDVDRFFSKIKGRKFSFSSTQVESVALTSYQRSWERGYMYGLQEHLKSRKVDYDLRNLMGIRE